MRLALALTCCVFGFGCVDNPTWSPELDPAFHQIGRASCRERV